MFEIRFVLRLVLISSLLIVSCSTPQKRAEEKSTAFAALSQEEQRLVLEGRIREGMNPDAVYIALGRPAKEREARMGGRNHVHWIYSRMISREVPAFRREYYRGSDGRLYGQTYYDPYYESYVVDTFRVIFENNRVVGWEEL
ncbi:MAG: hypothetical protein ACFCUX_02225 [Candidatus Methylacidiphilales bacterium]